MLLRKCVPYLRLVSSSVTKRNTYCSWAGRAMRSENHRIHNHLPGPQMQTKLRWGSSAPWVEQRKLVIRQISDQWDQLSMQYISNSFNFWDFPGGSVAGTPHSQCTGRVWPLKAMALHSSTLAWKIPWTEESGRLQSMGSLRVGHYWATSLSLFTFMHWRRK